jgi:hypothetical protein
MTEDEYTKQAAEAQAHRDAFTVPGDGQGLPNSLVYMRLLETFFHLPCGQGEEEAAIRIRRNWARMSANGADWSKWATKDLEHMFTALDTLADSFLEARGTLGLYLVARKLRED